jgi:hypothetical protein
MTRPAPLGSRGTVRGEATDFESGRSVAQGCWIHSSIAAASALQHDMKNGSRPILLMPGVETAYGSIRILSVFQTKLLFSEGSSSRARWDNAILFRTSNWTSTRARSVPSSCSGRENGRTIGEIARGSWAHRELIHARDPLAAKYAKRESAFSPITTAGKATGCLRREREPPLPQMLFADPRHLSALHSWLRP